MKTGKRILVVILFFLSVAAGTSAGNGTDPVSAGTSAASRVRNTWTTEEGFRKITKAITTGSIPLKTLDRSKEGIARINCPGSRALFEILVQPQPSGDLSFISVAYDSDLDGNFDGRYLVQGPVSGVCANGFVKCRAGTWNDCHWYAWQYDGRDLFAEEVSPHALGGCYCINSGCTDTDFFHFKDQVLRSLAAGVAGAMAAAEPRLSAAEAEIEGTVIRYYAQNAGDCSLTQGRFSAYGFENAEDIYENSALLVSAAEAEVASQSSDPESLYYLLTHSPAFTNSERLTCRMHRTVYFDAGSCEVRETLSNSCTALEARADCRLEMEKAFDVNGAAVVTYRDFNPTGISPVPSCDSVYIDPFCSFDTPVSGSTCKGFVVGPSRCGESCVQFQGSAGAAGGSASIILTLTQGQIDSLKTVTVHWCTNTYSSGTCFDDDGGVAVYVNGQRVLRVTYGDCEPCSFTRHIPIEAFRPGENTIVFRNWAGKKPGSGCRPFTINFLFSTRGVEREICYDWWEKERTYVCSSHGNITPDVSRAEAISETLAEGQSRFTYQDPPYGTGVVEFSLTQGEDCIPACKLRRVEERAQAAPAATTADYRSDPSTQVFIYRTCVDGECPVREGEEVVEDCRCLNEFNLAVATMQTLRQAAIDLICSDGQKH